MNWSEIDYDFNDKQKLSYKNVFIKKLSFIVHIFIALPGFAYE